MPTLKKRGQVSSIQSTLKRKAASMSPIMHRTVHQVHYFEPLGVYTAEDDGVLHAFAKTFGGPAIGGTAFNSDPIDVESSPDDAVPGIRS